MYWIVKLTKLSEVDNPDDPGNIPVGYEVTRLMARENFIAPTVGKRFFVGRDWSTSVVQEILSEDTFRTLNSIYQWSKKFNSNLFDSGRLIIPKLKS